ncbi:MAG: hypothetical protein PHT51_03715 [Patescibacteria group bacterium]|nr:hypothetical protein [Patescibacteria group bacterium]MDD4611321.1 hypothetical protein [Patescibacteria group bacterium]
MDKKTKTIVIVVLAVVVVGGLYFEFNRWRQQRLANQILKEMYGVNTGLLGGLTGGNGISKEIAQELAKEAVKQEAQQKADEAKEAAKTPEDKYNETKETAVVGEVSPIVASEIEPAIKAVFGETKMTSYGTGYMVSQNGSFGANFSVPRVVTADDLNKLSLEFKNKGYAVVSSSAESGSGNVTMMKGEESTLTFSYSDNGETQEIEVLYWQLSAN